MLVFWLHAQSARFASIERHTPVDDVGKGFNPAVVEMCLGRKK